jgi:hypothetical protein
MLAQAAPHEMVEVPKRLARVAQTKVFGPASQVPVQSPNPFGQGSVTLLWIDESSQRLPLSRHRFARGLQVEVALGSSSILVAVIPKGVAQKIQALARLAQVQYTRLVAVDLHTQPSFRFALNPVAQLGADVAGQNDKVVGRIFVAEPKYARRILSSTRMKQTSRMMVRLAESSASACLV